MTNPQITWQHPQEEKGCEQMSKEEMIREAGANLEKLYYEDIEFICKLIEQVAEKRGIKK